MEETKSPLTLQRMPCRQDEESQQSDSKGFHGNWKSSPIMDSSNGKEKCETKWDRGSGLGHIINKTSISGKKNVFALYLDLNTGLVFTYPAPSRGLAGPSLQAYIQRYGPPATILSDNAKEFTGG